VILNHIPHLDRLRVFFHVFSSGSITAAARQLHLTKSAVSQGIKLLQEELGERLFVHKGRSLVPTEAGRSLFSTIEPFLMALVVRFPDSTEPGGLSALLRIASPPIFGFRHLLPAIIRFHKQYSKIRFEIQLTAAVTPLRRLEDDELDFCIADSLDIMYGQHSHFHVRELMTDPEYVVASKTYWKRSFGKEPTYQELVNSKFISYHAVGAEICAWMQTYFGRSPKRLEPVLVVDRADAVMYAVSRGVGLGMVPSSQLGKHLKNGSLVAVGGKKYPFQNSMVLVTLREKKPSVAQNLFLEHLYAIRRISGPALH
jgi:DNA-binding transcriptional LysR family regulator